MIPDEQTIIRLWNTYSLSPVKRNHSTLVARVALFLAREVEQKLHIEIDKTLLNASALLHDIDKNIEKQNGERHPDTGVRVLTSLGYKRVASVIKTHSLSSVLDPSIRPTTWEEKLLYLADKMVKHTVITVDERFALWRGESLPQAAYQELDAAYPLVKELEKEVFGIIGIRPESVSEKISGIQNLQ